MTTLLILIITTSILVLGWTIASQRNMLFHGIRVWAEENWPTLMKPVCLCHWCMPSIWSLFGYSISVYSGLIGKVNFQTIVMYPLVVCGSSLLCGMVWALYQMFESVSEFFYDKNKRESED